MKHINAVGVMLILLTGFYPPNLFADADAQEIVIIGNQNTADSVTKGEIKEIFLGKKTRWADNTGLTFVIFKDEETYGAFLKAYVGKTVSQYSSYWKIQVFNGTGRMPQFFQDKAQVLKFVSETQGAVAFLSSGKIAADRVKILSVK